MSPGCDTWSFTLREERRLRVFDNRLMRRIFGPKRDEVIGEWKKLHKEELNDNTHNTRRMKWARLAVRRGRGEVYTGFLLEKPERKILLGKPSHRWEDNIKTYRQEVGCGGMDSIDVAQVDR